MLVVAVDAGHGQRRHQLRHRAAAPGGHQQLPERGAADPRIAPAQELRAALATHYADNAIVSVGGLGVAGELLLRRDSAPSDRLRLDLFASADDSQIRLVAMLDNLGKGAGGACVQNLNIMTGMPETLGLRLD